MSLLVVFLGFSPKVTWTRILGIHIPAEAGGKLSKKLFLACESGWFNKADMKLVKKLLSDLEYAGETNILQEKFLEQHVPIFRCKKKDLRACKEPFTLNSPASTP